MDKLQNSAIYIKYKKYDYKFGDLDLLNSGGSLGKSQLTFGIFYDDIAMDETINEAFWPEAFYCSKVIHIFI